MWGEGDILVPGELIEGGSIEGWEAITPRKKK
jgi:hypothetical protein